MILFQKLEYIRIYVQTFLSFQSLPLSFRFHHPGLISVPYVYRSLHFWVSLDLLCKCPVFHSGSSSTVTGDVCLTPLSCDTLLAASSRRFLASIQQILGLSEISLNVTSLLHYVTEVLNHVIYVSVIFPFLFYF